MLQQTNMCPKPGHGSRRCFDDIQVCQERKLPLFSRVLAFMQVTGGLIDELFFLGLAVGHLRNAGAHAPTARLG